MTNQSPAAPHASTGHGPLPEPLSQGVGASDESDVNALTLADELAQFFADRLFASIDCTAANHLHHSEEGKE